MRVFEEAKAKQDSMTDALSKLAKAVIARPAEGGNPAQDRISYQTIQEVLEPYTDEKKLKGLAEKVLSVLHKDALENLVEAKSSVCLNVIEAVPAFVMIQFCVCDKLKKSEVFYET